MSVVDIKDGRELTPAAQILVIDDDADLLRLLAMRPDDEQVGAPPPKPVFALDASAAVDNPL